MKHGVNDAIAVRHSLYPGITPKAKSKGRTACISNNYVTFVMKCEELFRILKKAGWNEIHQKGSHKILRKEGEEKFIVLPYHPGKEVPTGTCNHILNRAGLK